MDAITTNAKFEKSFIIKFFIVFYAPVTCWFGFNTSTLFLEKIYLFLLLLLFIYYVFTAKTKINIPVVLIPFALWVLWVLFTSFLSAEPMFILIKMVGVSIRVFSVIIIVNFVLWSRCVSCLLYSYVLATLVSGLLIVILPASYTDLGGRFIGTTGNANSFGIQVTASIAVSIYLILNAKYQWLRIFNIFSTLFFLYLIIGSGSRKAIIGVFIIIVIYVLYQFKNIYKQSVTKAISFVFVTVLFLIAISFSVLESEHGDRFTRLYDAYVVGDKSAEGISEKGRLGMYKLGWQTAMENPFFGIGLDNFQTIKSGFFKQSVGTYAHSNYIEILVGTGLFGFALYYYMWGMVLYRFWSKKNVRDNLMVIGVSLTWVTLMYDFAGVSYYHKISWLIFVLIFYCLERYRLGDDIKESNGAMQKFTNKKKQDPIRYLHLK